MSLHKSQTQDARHWALRHLERHIGWIATVASIWFIAEGVIAPLLKQHGVCR